MDDVLRRLLALEANVQRLSDQNARFADQNSRLANQNASLRDDVTESARAHSYCDCYY